MDHLDYNEKYNKYKKKYLEIKNNKFPNNYYQIGTGLDVFKNTTRFYIMAIINNKSIINQYNSRRNILLLGETPKNRLLHITLMQLHINQDNEYSHIFLNPNFHKRIKLYYNKTLASKEGLILFSSKNKYEDQYDILGDGPGQHFVKIYIAQKKMAITNFRTLVYRNIQKQLGKSIIKTKKIGDQTYKIITYPNKSKKPLLAIPDYYYGKGEWKPHVSIFSLIDLKENNRELFKKYKNLEFKKKKINFLVKHIKKIGIKPIKNINLKTNVGPILISLRNINYGINKEFFV